MWTRISRGFVDFYKEQAAFDIFLKGMTGGSRLAAQALAKLFPWESYNTVIDIGTAQGCVPVEIARAHPHLTGGGFDLPEMQAAFATYVRVTRPRQAPDIFSGKFLRRPSAKR